MGGAAGYGWLGAKQRSSDAAGLTLMGVRVYNPTTGQFTSTDPVPGGNDTAYTYPNDPINSYDLDGRWGFKKWFKKKWKSTRSVINVVGRVAYRGIKICSAIAWGTVGAGCNAAVAVHDCWGGWRSRSCAAAVAGAVVGTLVGSGGKRFYAAALRGSRGATRGYRRVFGASVYLHTYVAQYSVGQGMNPSRRPRRALLGLD